MLGQDGGSALSLSSVESRSHPTTLLCFVPLLKHAPLPATHPIISFCIYLLLISPSVLTLVESSSHRKCVGLMTAHRSKNPQQGAICPILLEQPNLQGTCRLLDQAASHLSVPLRGLRAELHGQDKSRLSLESGVMSRQTRGKWCRSFQGGRGVPYFWTPPGPLFVSKTAPVCLPLQRR